MKNSKPPKILVIIGPTATGKSELAVKLAKKYNGEVISADSRQVYKGLDIGTGKITKKEMRGIRHHMLDIVSPKKVFNVADWKKETEKIISDIVLQGKLPVICGGTGFYIQSIVDGLVLPEVPPNKILRKKLERKGSRELLNILKRLDKRRVQNIDQKNPVRLIRAIEIARKLGAVPEINRNQNKYKILQIGLTLPSEKLRERISTRLFARIREGMIGEAKRLKRKGLSWKRMRELGLEYRYLAGYLQKKISKKELLDKIENGNFDYSKRQMTWFKRDKKIKWFNPNKFKQINSEIRNFLTE